MDQKLILTFTILLTAFAAHADDRASIIETVRSAFAIDADDLLQSVKTAPEIRDEMPFPSKRMVVTSVAERASIHQLCLSVEGRTMTVEGFGAVSDAGRARFKAFLVENLGSHGLTRKIAERLPTPVSASVEQVSCFTDASDAVLALTYRASGEKYFKIEIAVDPFN